MKYIVALALFGATQGYQSEASLVQLNSEAGSWADFGSDDESSLVQLEAPCVYLDETQEELDY